MILSTLLLLFLLARASGHQIDFLDQGAYLHPQRVTLADFVEFRQSSTDLDEVNDVFQHSLIPEFSKMELVTGDSSPQDLLAIFFLAFNPLIASPPRAPGTVRSSHKALISSDSLPPGWQAVRDEESGKYFYHNSASGVTQWEIPADEDSPLPPGWQAILDEESGKMFYYESASGISQWEAPTIEGVEVAPAATPNEMRPSSGSSLGKRRGIRSKPRADRRGARVPPSTPEEMEAARRGEYNYYPQSIDE